MVECQTTRVCNLIVEHTSGILVLKRIRVDNITMVLDLVLDLLGCDIIIECTRVVRL